MADRLKDQNWVFNKTNGNYSDAHCTMALLMDLRDEMKRNNELMQRLVGIMECRNTLQIPHTLKRIDKRLAKQLPLK